jgi:hypothetical protein
MMLRVAAAFLVALLLTVGAADAQGRGLGLGKVRGAPAPSESASSAVSLQLSPSFPQFGTWLDDATTAVGGVGYASIGASFWRGANADQIDAPILGVTYGLTNRTQLSATVPFYRANYEGFSGSGLDNIYISGKIAVVDPDARGGRVGFAVGAAAEILGAGFADVSRAHWVVPLSAELRIAPVRLYASTGYFSRGAFFAAGAIEWTVPSGTSLTASLAHSVSVHGVTVATTASVPNASSRDASLLVSQSVSSNVSVYVAGSRTFSETWIDGASSLSAGVAFRFAGPRTRAARVAGDVASP